MAKDDDGLIREVNEAYRQDRAKEWWDKFGTRVLAVSLSIIAITAGVVLYQQHTLSVQEERSAAFFRAFEWYQAEKYEEALEALTPLTQEEPNSGVTALARLYHAHATMRAEGKPVESGTFAKIAKGAPEPIAALAAIQSVYAAEPDAPAAIAEQWFAPAMQQMRLAEAIQSDEPKEVATLDAPVPPALEQRLDILEAVLDRAIARDAE